MLRWHKYEKVYYCRLKRQMWEVHVVVCRELHGIILKCMPYQVWSIAFLVRRIDHFTIVCLVAWSLNESEADVDLVLIETSLLFLCKLLLSSMRTATLTKEKQGSFYQNKSSPTSLSFKGHGPVSRTLSRTVSRTFRATKASCQTEVRRTAVWQNKRLVLKSWSLNRF